MRTKEELTDVLKLHNVDLESYRAGEGGSAFVHHGRRAAPSTHMEEVPSGSQLAIKEYKDEVVAKPEQILRIRQEVEVGRAVRHPNVVPIHCLIEEGDWPPLLVMDWISGEPLDRWATAGEAGHNWEEIGRIARGLVEGLDTLHRKQIRHRDVKPANVFVRSDGEPVLMDMGVVEVASSDESTLHTSVGDFIGSVRHAAPQFIRGEPFDFADDIYALGATLFLLVTRKEVFADVGRKPLLPHYILTQRVRVGEVDPGVPSQISVLLEGALHPDRKRRPSLGEMRAFFANHENATYLHRELDARNREQRGYQVIAVHDQGATLIVDLRGAEPKFVRHVVVRELKPVRVPSLGGEAKPEKWIADVELKHRHNGVGHFAVQGKRWEPGKPGRLALSMGTDLTGTPPAWVEYDKQTDVVRPGDLVVSDDSA